MLVPMKEPFETDLSPEAILKLTMAELDARYPGHLREDSDDLDGYREIAFLLNGMVPVVLRRYAGHPADSVTVFFRLSDSEQGVDVVTTLVARVARSLGLADERVVWQRRDGIEGWSAARVEALLED